ncbi:MAG: UDP-N-acetylglucosamine 2-epimerase [Phycisphaerales bacterium]|nr:UDP-N-acetylglucosamine 2-epimerase [Phycisphaerales bacterium]
MSETELQNRGRKRRVLVVTGTRAEFGLLRPVMKAVLDREELELLVVAAGAHLVQPALTFKEVKAEFEVADSIPMQTAGRVGRQEDVEALGKGIGRFGRSFSLLEPDWVVVLGDRIEAFAAASAASIGGWALAHIHGGDRAEGVADEAMRHAMTKLSNLHLPATEGSAERIRRMGEDPERVLVVGSPAIDGLGVIPALGDGAYAELGSPEVVVLMHPCGREDDVEAEEMRKVLKSVEGKRVLVMHPNLDPGRRGIVQAIKEVEGREGVVVREHLVRDVFVGLLKRVGVEGGALVGNSSSGLIECSAIGCPSVDVGDRQSGRERCAGLTVHVESGDGVGDALRELCSCVDKGTAHPYGDGTAGVAIARMLAEIDPTVEGFTRKRCVY